MTLSIMTFRIITQNVMTFSIMTLNATILSKHDTWHNNTIIVLSRVIG